MNLPSMPRRLFYGLTFVVALLTYAPSFLVAQADDPQGTTLETVLRRHDSQELESLRTQLEEQIRQNPNDPQSEYQLARVHACLADVAEIHNDKKAASAAIDKAFEAA